MFIGLLGRDYEGTGLFRSFGNHFQSTRQYIPKGLNLHKQCSEDLQNSKNEYTEVLLAFRPNNNHSAKHKIGYILVVVFIIIIGFTALSGPWLPFSWY